MRDAVELCMCVDNAVNHEVGVVHASRILLFVACGRVMPCRWTNVLDGLNTAFVVTFAVEAALKMVAFGVVPYVLLCGAGRGCGTCIRPGYPAVLFCDNFSASDAQPPHWRPYAPW